MASVRRKSGWKQADKRQHKGMTDDTWMSDASLILDLAAKKYQEERVGCGGDGGPCLERLGFGPGLWL